MPCFSFWQAILDLLRGHTTLLADPETEAWDSVASLWEIVIKESLGKLELGRTFTELFPAELEDNDFQLLPVEIRHLERLRKLPFAHLDPFDRLLIAQAIEDSLAIVSQDEAFAAYPVPAIW